MRFPSFKTQPHFSTNWTLAARVLTSMVCGVGVALAVHAAVTLGHPEHGSAVDAWRRHHEECLRLPEELYHRDRFRAIEGRVTDDEGMPVRGAVVRCAKIESLLEVAQARAPSLEKWAVPIEAETCTNGEGRYAFPYLPIGARSFFYHAPGRGLAPAIRDLVVVQDGLGAQLDVTLVRCRSLRVRLKASPEDGMPLYLIPDRWWPSLPAAVVAKGEHSVTFSGLGGPLRRGLIAWSAPAEPSRIELLGRYDLDRSDEAVLDSEPSAALRLDIPEAAGLEAWHDPPTPGERLFFAAMSPIALFWPAAANIGRPRAKPANPALSPPLPILPQMEWCEALRRILSFRRSSSRAQAAPG